MRTLEDPMRLFALAATLLALACTNENEVKELESEPLVSKGKTANGVVGVNSKNEAVIREERAATDELSIQQMSNSRLQEELDRELQLLKWCRRDIADPRLNGSGKIQPIPAIDDMKPLSEVREEIGLDGEGDLKVVKEEYFNERLKTERKFETSLRSMLKVSKDHREDCEQKMAEARMQAGLAPERYQGDGYFSNGVWVERQKAERSLSDAFEIAAKAKQDAAKSNSGNSKN
jgi:hypothetical protein